MNRRKLIKNLSLTLGGAIIAKDSIAGLAKDVIKYDIPVNPTHKPFDKPVTAITLGAGGRGNVYGGFALAYPDQLKIVGVAEPLPYRNDTYTAKHKIPQGNRFKTWEDVFTRPKFADAIIISTPDNLHYGPCIKALEMGYDILLEKPIAPTEKECRSILAMAKKTKRIVAVCHVLRYAPYFVKMKQLIAAGTIGPVMSVQHLEPIEHTHMAHSYVRGNWHNSKLTTPIILAKSCHDVDIVKWVINKPSREIIAMGDLKWFKKENAPEGSTNRCTDGCKIERTCPYSAIREYADNRARLEVLDIPPDAPDKRAAILDKLKVMDYGRCVYRMDNDQPDHYITNIRFAEGITANFSMEAFTSYAGCRTRVFGAMGDMVGDMTELVVTDFRTGKSTTYKPIAEDVEGYKNSGHGGGDWVLARDFVQAVAHQDPTILTSTIDESIESHLMCFAAERSRVTKMVTPVVI